VQSVARGERGPRDEPWLVLILRVQGHARSKQRLVRLGDLGHPVQRLAEPAPSERQRLLLALNLVGSDRQAAQSSRLSGSSDCPVDPRPRSLLARRPGSHRHTILAATAAPPPQPRRRDGYVRPGLTTVVLAGRNRGNV